MRWRRTLESGQVIQIGRAPAEGVWAVPWENRISRRPSIHLDVDDSTLVVKCLESAKNGVLYGGKLVREARLAFGEYFEIGDTTFRFVESPAESRSPIEVHVFKDNELRTLAGANESGHIEALAKVPRLVIDCTTEEELAGRLADLLIDNVSRANSVAVVAGDVGNPARVLAEQSRDQDDIVMQPSKRLVATALERGRSVLHAWEGEPSQNDLNFTFHDARDWAFCVPIRHAALKGWRLYMSGLSKKGQTLEESLGDSRFSNDLRFVELLADFLGSTSQVRHLEDRQSEMSRFFSPKVMHLLTEQNMDLDQVLQPQSSDIGVLFCDLRGFSRSSEANRHDLVSMLGRVSAALEVMTRNIMDQDGVVTDFQGDSALGFWGWPTRPDGGPLAACRAALAIQSEFGSKSKESDSPLAGFKVGVGVAWGNAVAGRIGPDQIIKVGVFGPVVNLCARLEGMTKMMRAPILIDEKTADAVRLSMPQSEGRSRRLCRVLPAGMDQPVMVSELLPPESEETLSDEHLARYEQALDAFIEGDWLEAIDLLGELPTRDRGKDFLMIHIAQNQYDPPANWNGTIALSSK